MELLIKNPMKRLAGPPLMSDVPLPSHIPMPIADPRAIIVRCRVPRDRWSWVSAPWSMDVVVSGLVVGGFFSRSGMGVLVSGELMAFWSLVVCWFVFISVEVELEVNKERDPKKEVRYRKWE